MLKVPLAQPPDMKATWPNEKKSHFFLASFDGLYFLSTHVTFLQYIHLLAVVYFDQLLGNAGTQKLVETLYLSEISQKLVKNLKKSKNQPKKDDFELPPQGVDQLLHVDQI